MNLAENILTPHQLSALHYKDHISLTANAGSGKTFVLSKRYLEIALNENVRLRDIAAITFTDKAAGELYRKIVDEVEQRLNRQKDEIYRRKLRKIRRELVSANISTIHSFCIDILKEYPVEASLDANFQPIDESLSNELIELSIEEVIKSAFQDQKLDEDLKYLIRVFSSKRIFAEELFSLIKNRKNVLDLEKNVYDKPAKQVAENLHKKFLEFVDKIYLVKKNIVINYLKEINNSVLNIEKSNGIALSAAKLINKLKEKISPKEYLSIQNDIKNLICTKESIKLRTRGYLPAEIRNRIAETVEPVEKFFKEIKDISLSKNHTEVEIELAIFGKKLLKFFNKCCNLYEEKKRENSYVDFEDILLYTKKILKNEDVRKALSEKFKYIMVDEYQDTNEIQYQIFLPILNDLKSGNLFIVGDEKQSIYMFRDAELEVFSRTKKNIENVSGRNFLLTLPDSFRMTPEICLFTNNLFENLFKDPNDLYNEVGHSELVCAREENLKGKIEILIGDDNEKSENSESELVAKRILKLVSENKNSVNWNDIVVLVRKRKNFSDLEKILSKYKIPFNIVGGTGFYQKQIVYDIYNYFNFLLDSNNDTALVGILRSPFFNLSDAVIFGISRTTGTGFWDKFQKYCYSHKEISSAKEILSENLALVKSYEPTVLLRKILNETNYLSVLASRPNGVQELANIEKLIGLTTSFNQQTFRTTYDYLNFLKESIEKTEEESQASIAEASNSVKIMTLHQAKGLEFKAVFLFKSDEITPISSIHSKKITVGKGIGLLTKVPLNENYFSEYEAAPVVNIFNHIIKKKELAEVKRLFYVGITRAMDYLFISATYKKESNYSESSFMGLLYEGLKPDFNSDEFNIPSQLIFLKRIDNKYSTESKKISISIPIVKEIKESYEAKHSNIFDLPQKLNLDVIKDLPEGEIISATKLSVFYQCPLKYQLTYEYGLSNLMNLFRNRKSDIKISIQEFNPLEALPEGNEGEQLHNLADVKGRIIHKILQMDTEMSDIKETTKSLLTRESILLGETNFDVEKLCEDIVSDLIRFYKSAVISEISGSYNYKSEFEIYCMEENYFLFGIIDRIIFENRKIIIIDFKTDNIKKNEIQQRFESYLTQLKFYAYIVSRLYKHIEEFELRIIFIKHPDENPSLSITRSSMFEVKNYIGEMIREIRKGTHRKNLSHCQKCNFAVNLKRCIVN